MIYWCKLSKNRVETIRCEPSYTRDYAPDCLANVSKGMLLQKLESRMLLVPSNHEFWHVLHVQTSFGVLQVHVSCAASRLGSPQLHD